MNPIKLFALGLTLVFIILKLTSHINWSWWWVFSPLWILLAIDILILLLVILLVSIFTCHKKPKLKRRMKKNG
jgi:membrane protein YdbS with pleckstrin-like domain|tara:strand:- start:3849 stop:4067 length:219 start_codon:yes stop_codon:yes gene_type:complete